MAPDAATLLSASSSPDLAHRVERALALYKPVLPPIAIHHFARVTTFLLGIHPAARRWIDVLRRAHPEPPAINAASLTAEGSPDESPPIDGQLIDKILAELGLLSKRETLNTTGRVQQVLYESEMAVALLIEATFPDCAEPGDCSRALDHFIATTLAALLAGAWGALLRRHGAGPPASVEDSVVTPFFARALLMMYAAGLPGDDEKTLRLYFVQSRRIAAVAAHFGSAVAAEQARVVAFLDRMSRALVGDGVGTAREVLMAPARMTKTSAPWAFSLLAHELGEGGRKARKANGPS